MATFDPDKSTANFPTESMEKLAREMKHSLKAYGVKFYLIIKNNNWQPVSRCIYHTDNQHPYDIPLGDINAAVEGLATEVIKNKTWLLLEKMTKNPKEEQRCIIGKSITDVKEFEIMGIKPTMESAVVDTKGLDDESSIIYLPVLSNNKVIGLIGAWKKQKTIPNNEPSFIVEEVLHVFNVYNIQYQLLFEHILSCWNHNRETAFYRGLLDKFKNNNSIKDTHNILLEAIINYSGAGSALLFEQNQYTGNTAYRIASSINRTASKLTKEIIEHKYVKNCKVDVLEHLINKNCTKHDIPFKVRSKLTISGEKAHHWHLILLEDSSRTDKNYLPEHIDGDEKTLNKLFEMAYRQFEQYLTSHIRYWIRSLNEIDTQEQNELLKLTAEQLHKASECDAVLTYTLDSIPRVFHSVPAINLNDIEVTKSSLTHMVINEGKAVFVFDMHKKYTGKPKSNRTQLDTVRAALGWETIRSWFSCPIVKPQSENKTSYGMFKLLTKSEYLSWAQLRLVTAITDRTYLYYRPLYEQNVLNKINDLSHQLAAFQGDKLKSELTQKFENWLHKEIRQDYDFVIIAGVRSPTDRKGSVLFFTESKVTLELNEDDYLNASSKLGNENGFAKTREHWFMKAKDKPIAIGENCYYSSIKVPGDSQFFGHLFILSKRKLAEHQVLFFDSAASELGAVLYQEKLGRQWSAATGRYRHAIIGPVMGIESLANGILEKLNDIDDINIAEDYRHMIEEVSLISNWRHYQRLLSDSIKVLPKIRELKPYMDRWIRRFNTVCSARNINLTTQWLCTSSQCEFDDAALDIAFSNLLENALKFSPVNSAVILKVFLDNIFLNVEISNTGPSLDNDMLLNIQKEGIRGQMDALQRIVPGQGIGLPLAKALVEAHDQAKLSIESVLNYDSQHADYLKDHDAEITATIQLLHRRRKGDRR